MWDVGEMILLIPPLLLALSLHEWAHGYTALQCGDPTAKMAGRLTLNPMAHLDLVGTLMLVITAVVTRTPFGWAKPVPVNYAYLRVPKRDMAIVAAAGPLANVMLGVVSAWILRAWMTWGAILPAHYPLVKMLVFSVMVNCGLAAFNVLPVFPLDGSRILTGLLPYPYSERYARLEPYGFLILMVLFMTRVTDVLIVPIFRALLTVMNLVSGGVL